MQFSGVTSDADLDAGALSNDKVTWGDWIDVDPEVITSTAWTVGSDGMNVPVYLRLRDIYDQTAIVVTGTVGVDTTDPIAAISPISPTQNSTTFPVSWSGIDATSGIKDFDIQYKDGNGSWTDWITGTVALTADFTGQENHTYYFRTRARDNAGNSGDYSVTNIQTTIDVYPYDLFLPVVSK